MKKVFAVAAVGLMVLSGAAVAQQGNPLEIAQARQVCGADYTPISAEFLADGRLKVTCPEGSAASAAAAGGTVAQPAVLTGTALGGGAGAALAGLVLVIAISGGDDSSTTTTTTTTTTTN